MKISTLWVVGLIAVVGLLLFGGYNQPVEASSVIQINYWMWHDYPSDPFLQQLVNEFNATHPNIRVNLQVIPWGSFHQKLITAIAAGVAPQVARVHVNWLSELAQMGALMPLNDFIAKWPEASDISEQVWNLLKVQGYGDTKFVVPFQFVALYLYYRKDWFKAAGLTPPKTYVDFLKDAQALTKDTNGDGRIDQWGYGMRGARGGHDMWNTFANFFNRDGTINLNKEAVVEGTKWYADLYRKWKVCPPSAPSDGYKEYTADFMSGRTAMIIHHIGSSRQMVKALGDKVGAVPVPEGVHGYYTSAVPEGLAILAPAAKDPAVAKAAFEFISWWGSKEQVDKWCRHVGSVPVLRSLASLPYYKNDPFIKATMDSMEFAGHLPTVPATASFVEDTWPTVFGKLLLGEISAEQAVDAFYEHYGVTLNKK